MPVDGGRLNAHKTRQEDFRRRKDGRIKGDGIKRSKKDDKIYFDEVDPVELEKIKGEIRKKAKRSRTVEIVFLLVSAVIALIIFYWFTNRYD
ncbi:hypothetical protein [Marinirhabdus gelatinilytica]|uniref:Triple QxxK/R motif-containing protein n=1 Tax=Marinirhabdus gelatinilytica TaxID=1703343 RepID=A0A370QG08_9FLAO|nr:hypothetical protein [Marinirhabdus gelatinilytica]RDK87292.1 hypothetical protein C8D94_102479 [Marinirhabdus gelatinilytica]